MIKINNNRWKYRFVEFQRSLKNLSKGLSIKSPDEIYRAGILQLFEVSFELCWKTLKDYLDSEGYNINSPRNVIQQAFKDGIISNGHEWLEALENRNLIAHTYDENGIKEIENLIRKKYIKLLKKFNSIFKKLI